MKHKAPSFRILMAGRAGEHRLLVRQVSLQHVAVAIERAVHHRFKGLYFVSCLYLLLLPLHMFAVEISQRACTTPHSTDPLNLADASTPLC